MPFSPVQHASDALVAEPAVLDLSVIIVNYNVREFLEQALRSVRRAQRDLSVEVFVVDNNSVDGSVDMVREQFPGVEVIANETNVGFGAANNQAIRRARGRYLLILNPDTIVQEGTLTTLVRFMDAHPEAGAAGCTILNPDGTFAPESRRAFPTPAVAFYRITGLSRLLPHHPRFGRYNLTYLPTNAVAEVDALSGSCMLVRHEALYRRVDDGRAAGAAGEGAGLFDEDFFMYGEDLDWCYRIQQAGWKIYYTPETQIIHYKGESTKKGELRYVRLFYGAMLQFTEKHLEDRYDRLLAWSLRAGIMARAALSVVTRTLYHLRRPLLDALLVYAAVLGVALGRWALLDRPPPPLLFTAVAPSFALSTLCGIALSRGYHRAHLGRLRPVLAGVGLAFLMVATLSFFIKSIAFSRAVVLVSVPVVVLVLGLVRLVRRSRHAGPRRALLVGQAAEAERLAAMLATQAQPPFVLVGYVTASASAAHTPGVPRLGLLHHLRDLARLRHIDDVVFATSDLSNQTIFTLIQRLRDLPVQFKMLAEGQECIIGKASVSDLSTPPLVPAEAALGTLRSPAARRAFELTVSVPLGLLHPVCWLLGRLSGSRSFFGRLAAYTRQMPAVWRGRRALLGYHPSEPCPPPAAWGLKPGVFYLRDSITPPGNAADAVHPAYWRYARHQSASLDWDLLVRAVMNLRDRHG